MFIVLLFQSKLFSPREIVLSGLCSIFFRAIQRSQRGLKLHATVGRPTVLSERVQTAILEEIKEHDLMQGFCQTHDFHHLVRTKLKAERTEKGLSTKFKLAYPSNSSLKRFKTKVGITANIHTSSSKTSTCLRARAEVENSITAAAIIASYERCP